MAATPPPNAEVISENYAAPRRAVQVEANLNPIWIHIISAFPLNQLGFLVIVRTGGIAGLLSCSVAAPNWNLFGLPAEREKWSPSNHDISDLGGQKGERAKCIRQRASGVN